MTTDQHLKKWRWMASLGLIGIGFGASLLGEAILLKGSGATLWQWFVAGTVSLAVLNGGLCIFGDAIKHRVLFEYKKTQGS